MSDHRPDPDAPRRDESADDAALRDRSGDEPIGDDATGGDATGDDSTGDVVIPDDLSELEEQFERDLGPILAERDEYKQIAQRVAADFENYRKRAAAQRDDEVDRATGRLAEALLPVLDAAEAAYVQHPDEVGPLLNVMLGELRKHGLETLDLEGSPFDPSVAEAVAHEPGEGGEVLVAEVLRSGYRWRGKTLRPAMVRTRD